MAVVWDKSMTTGVADVDGQHQEIIRQINAFGAAMTAGKGREELGRMLDFVGKYAIDHFTKEEAHMARYRCPAAEANKAAHRAFVARFGELRKQFAAEGAKATLALDIYTELTTWLVKHIRGIDTKLAACVAEQQPALAGV